jgi:hypothetical protein
MNRVWSRFFRSTYRKEPISSFILTVGAVDAVIGGVDGQWSLMALGLGAVSVAIALRAWINQQRQFEPVDGTPIRYLPAQSSRPSLPMLTPPRKKG